MAVNQTIVSKRGLDILFQFLNPRDTLLLVNFTHPPSGDALAEDQKQFMRSYYEKELEAYGPVNSSFKFIEYEHVHVTDAMADFVNESTADVFAIAPRASKDRSSITEFVVNHVPMTVFLCKN
jgi:hypothetical protein